MHLFVSICALLASAVGLTDVELATALDGKVPTRSEAFTNARGKSVGRGLGAIVIERSVDDVWATLARYDDRAEYVPRIKSVAVLARTTDGAITRLRVRQEVDATLTTARYTAWYQLDAAAHVIHWKLDDTATDNTLADVDGEYRLYALAPARTLLVYRVYVDSGLKVPQSLQSYITVHSLPDLLHAIKRRVESGGTWKKR